MMSLRASKYRLSKRQVVDWMQDVYGLSLSLWSVSNAKRHVSASLEGIHASISFETCG